jgi:hypothetical protein
MVNSQINTPSHEDGGGTENASKGNLFPPTLLMAFQVEPDTEEQKDAARPRDFFIRSTKGKELIVFGLLRSPG